MTETKSPEAQIKEAAWTYTGWTVLVLLVFLGGVGLGYTLWGDAPRLRDEMKQKEGQLAGVRTERENLQHQIGRLQRQIESLQRAQSAEQAPAEQAPAEQAPAEQE